MPQLERWDNLPEAMWQHLIERMRDREISFSDLNQLRLWVETRPEVPEGMSPRAKPSDYRSVGITPASWPVFTRLVLRTPLRHQFCPDGTPYSASAK